jgi:hypothetical protein
MCCKSMNMKYHLWIVVLLCFGINETKAQTDYDSLRLVNFYKRIVYTLASDSLKGRQVGSKEERESADFIMKEWKAIKGFRPKIQPFNFRVNDTAYSEISSQNVYCFINNHSDSTIIIGAHYEHIGLGGNLSFAYSRRNQIHNGADDNASGIALLLGLSKTFRQWQNKRYNYIFVAYSAHEVGLFGSAAFYEFIRVMFPPTCQVFNFDMVGRLNKNAPAMNMYGMETLPEEEANRIKMIQTKIQLYLSFYGTILNTDCRIFATQKIKCLSFTTGLHDDYHKPDDDPEHINYEGIYTIQRMMEALFLK